MLNFDDLQAAVQDRLRRDWELFLSLVYFVALFALVVLLSLWSVAQ